MPVNEEENPVELLDDRASIDLRIDGDWSVEDFETLLASVRSIYNAGLAGYFAKESGLEVEPIDTVFGEEVRVRVEPVQATSELAHLTVEGPRHEVADAVGAAIEQGRKWSERPVSARGEVENFRLQVLMGDPLAIAPEARLTIDRIEMASEGVISLKGLGEPIKQLGKLIERLVRLPGKVKQDKLDREKAEIQNARDRIDTLEEFCVFLWGPEFRSNPAFAERIQDVSSGVQGISELAQSGRLLPA